MGNISRHWWVRVAGWLVLLGLGVATGPSAQAAETQRIAVLALQGKRLSNDILNLISDEVRAGVLDATKGQDFVVMSRENMSIILKDMGKDINCIEGECEVETGRNIGAAYVFSGTVLKIERSWVCTLKVHAVDTGALLAADKVVAPKALKLSDGVRVLAADLMRQALGEDDPEATASLMRQALGKDEPEPVQSVSSKPEAQHPPAEKQERAGRAARARTEKAEAKARAKTEKAEARERKYEKRRTAALATEGPGTVVVDNGWWAAVGVGRAKVSGPYGDVVSDGMTTRVRVGRKVGGVVLGGVASTTFANAKHYEEQAANGCAQAGTCIPGDISLIRSGAFAVKGLYRGGIKIDLIAQSGLALLSSPIDEKYFNETVVSEAWGLKSSPDIGVSNKLGYVGAGVAIRKAVHDGRPTADFQVVADYILGFGVMTDVTVGIGAAF
jgi:hypothetical protein